MRVLADVDEADVGRLEERMQADAVVDAFPGESFHGIVAAGALSARTPCPGVVTYSAVVEVENPDEKLRPGMTATVTIKHARGEGGRSQIPNAALRYKPTPPDGPDGKPIPPPPEPPLAKGQGRVYVLTSDKPGDEKEEQKLVPIGVTDGIFTELTGDELPAATKVVTDETDDEEEGDVLMPGGERASGEAGEHSHSRRRGHRPRSAASRRTTSAAAGVVRALRDVDLTIERGEFVAIVGTSGSGKSTLMNILGCLDRPTRGTYTLAGARRRRRARNDGRAIVRNRLIGFIFQGFNLLPRTTALENVRAAAPVPRLQPRASARSARSQALAQVGLADRVHHTPNQLSGGQQQRVAIARALVTDPPLLLADEPTGNLDTRTSLEVLALLQALNRRPRHHDLPRHARARHRRLRVARHHGARRAHRERRRAGRPDRRREGARGAPAAAGLRAGPRAAIDLGDGGARVGIGGPGPVRRLRDDGARRAARGRSRACSTARSSSAAGARGLSLASAVLGRGVARRALRASGASATRSRATSECASRSATRSLFTLPVVALGVFAFVQKLPVALVDEIDQLSRARVALALVVLLLVLASVTLLRYLLLSLFTPAPGARPRRAPVAMSSCHAPAGTRSASRSARSCATRCAPGSRSSASSSASPPWSP